MNIKIPSQVQSLPRKPGCYIFKKADGDILYVGKAIDLKNRVSSYWHKSSQLTPHKQLMIPQIKKVEYIITSSESEALMLESTLIKQHQPPFNIDLKDDKSFLYIKITLTEEYPRVFTVRRVQPDGARYFGPYVSAMSVRQTLHMLRQLFPHRNFDKPITNYRTKYLIKRYPELMGPADKTEYRQTIGRIMKFLKGDYEPVQEELKKKMADLSRRQLFEKAGQIRDSLNSIAYLTEKQKVISPKLEDMDIISLARPPRLGEAGDKQLGAINLFTVRYGKLLCKQVFTIKNIIDQTDAEAVQAFMEQFYPQVTDLPKEIVIPIKISGRKLFERTFKCKLTVPERGFRKQYVSLGEENAEQFLTQQKASWEKDEAKSKQALSDFKNLLNLPNLPKRIEIFDISNIQGADAVGSMVVFTNGRPDKKWYRKFKIKTVKGANDPAMLAEMVSRRFAHVGDNKNKTAWPKPDLVILDGGKGQLSVVRHKTKINIPIVAIAKREEEIFVPGKPVPIRFPQNSEALFLIQRMRDEAHRFAINFFRKTHVRGARKSLLDAIPGLGAASRKKLIKAFGSALGVRDAGEPELAAVVGLVLAKTIKENI
ncbi:MAG: excinuclease ABC subunit UvrC [Patescibacteria group bacterium]